MRDAVLRFLSTQPASLSRVALVESGKASYLVEEWTPYGSAWRELAEEIGFACHDALVELGDASADRFIYFAFRGHQYAMLTPEGARAERRHLADLAARWPEYARFAAMLPLFGEDGDSLLLDAAGAIWFLPHDDVAPEAPVAPDLESLLDAVGAPAVNL